MKRLRLLAVALATGGIAVALWLAALQVTLPSVAGLETRAPFPTAMMRQRAAEAREKGRPYRIDQRWVRYEGISPLLRRAVLTAEDAAFFSHDGLDWNEIRASARRNLARGRVVRGGSTITQQLARNLYLGSARTPTRKAREVMLALRLERALSKRRIFELYLNLIEWGDGVYGAEAAARRYFGVGAADLTARQAALLAAVIVNPRRFSPAAPVRRIDRRMRMILARMLRGGFLSREDYERALNRAPPTTPQAPPADGAPAPGDSAGAVGGPASSRPAPP